MGDSGADDYEKLFLLEVLVDNLFISNSKLNLDKSLQENLRDTCVLFQFLHYPPLVVCESDFIGAGASGQDSSHVTFKSGKSCFFSLRIPRSPILPVPFQVKVTVIRKLKEGVLPDKLEIGKTTVDMSNDFTDLLKQNTDENCDTLPLSKNKRGSFEIQDDQGKNVGSLTAFIRLSCFGKLIITQFSLNKEDKNSYLFKGTGVNKLCQTMDGKKFCTTGDKPTIGRSSPLYGGETASSRPLPTTEDRGQGQIPERDFQRMEYPQPSPLYPQGGYPPMGMGPTPCTYPMGPCVYRSPPPPSLPSGRGGRGGLCECPYPVPPSVMSKYTQRTSAAERNMGLTPGEVGLQDDQVVFQLPLKRQGDRLTEQDKQIDSSIYYKLTSAEETKEGQQKNTVHIKSDDLPGMAGKGAVSPVSGLPVDDGHDVFLLKIGKKCDGDKKRNLELELRTPKMKEPKPPQTDQNTQYLESDIPKSEKKGSKDKGKKGKNGKGKKGKK